MNFSRSEDDFHGAPQSVLVIISIVFFDSDFLVFSSREAQFFFVSLWIVRELSLLFLVECELFADKKKVLNNLKDEEETLELPEEICAAFCVDLLERHSPVRPPIHRGCESSSHSRNSYGRCRRSTLPLASASSCVRPKIDNAVTLEGHGVAWLDIALPPQKVIDLFEHEGGEWCVAELYLFVFCFVFVRTALTPKTKQQRR